MTERSTRPAERAYDIDAYLVYAAQLHHDEPPYLVLEPYESDHKLCPASPGGYKANLIDEGRRRGHVPLGELVQLAVEHENARDGFADIPDMDEGTSRAICEIIGAAHQKALDDLRAEGRAELVGGLAALRQEWAALQKKATYIRETADGRSADIAGAQVDLYGQLITQLDRVVAG